MKKIIALVFLPIRLFFLAIRALFVKLSRGNHIYVKVPAKFSDSRKSFFLRKIQGEEEPPFITDFLTKLYLIRKDPRVKFLSLEIPKLDMGFAEVASIYSELQKIREKGVAISGFADEGDLKTLYLLSVCEKRYSSETSEFYSILPSTESLFFGDILKKWNVRVDVYRSGAYKSFGEIFTGKGFSKESKSNLTELINDLRSHLLEVLTSDSNLDESVLQFPILHSGKLKSVGFLHGFLNLESFREYYRWENPPEFVAELELAIDHQTGKDREKITEEYLKNHKPSSKKLKEQSVTSRNRLQSFRILGNNDPLVVVLPLKGQIVSGKPEETEPKSGIIEGYSLRNTIQEIKEDTKIKAVLLEIDSPGGSATESEKIFQAIKDLDKTKPVYAYMSNTCASGGYYIACAARKIYSAPYGIVGSIGTILMRFNMEGLYTKFGISKDRVGFYPMREIFSDSGKLSKESQVFLKKEISRVENLFLRRVEESRLVGKEVLDKMTGGRIFAPGIFRSEGFIDEILSLTSALEIIKEDLQAKSIQVDYQAPRYNMKLAFRESLPLGSLGSALGSLRGLGTPRNLRNLERVSGVDGLREFASLFGEELGELTKQREYLDSKIQHIWLGGIFKK